MESVKLYCQFSPSLSFSLAVYVCLSLPACLSLSLSFSLPRPRLGALLHRVVGVGLLYLIFSVVEGILRVNSVSLVSLLSDQHAISSIPPKYIVHLPYL